MNSRAARPSDRRRTLRHRFQSWWALGNASLWTIFLAITAAAFVALWATQRGEYVADARFEIYWSTRRYLEGHVTLWDHVRNLGRPSPYFSPFIGSTIGLLRWIGLSPATAERALHALMIGIGATGAAAVFRQMRPRAGVELWAVALAFGWAPYVSEFLVPSGLFFHYSLTPWVIYAFTLGTSEPGLYREHRPDLAGAGLFALLVFAMGAVNPASLFYSLLPLIPIALGTIWLRRATWRAIWGFTWRAALLSTLAGAAALISINANLPVINANLATTELPRTVSRFSSWSESWRGLGSWLSYFLGGGATASNPSPLFTTRLGIAASFAVPICAVAALWLSRARERGQWAGLMLMSLVVMVGLHPVDNPSPAGRLFSALFDAVQPAKSLRNGYKAGAGLVLAQAVLLGFGLEGVRRVIGERVPDRTVRTIAANAVGALACVAALAGGLPIIGGDVYPPNETVRAIPQYWINATEAVNDLPDDGRVLVVPGTNRARYRWGYPGDDILDALLTQPHASRSSLPQGTAEAADALKAIDAYASGPDYQPGVLAAMAKRLGFKWILVRNDLAWERIGAPRPSAFTSLRNDPTLRKINGFGAAGLNVVSGSAPRPSERTVSPVELYQIEDAPGLIQADTRPPLVVSGAGDSWPWLADAGLLDQYGPLAYLASRSTDAIEELISDGASFAVTDGDRRRSSRVTAERNYDSYTLSAADDGGERPPRPLFAGAADESVADYGAAKRIYATTPSTANAETAMGLRPAMAFDGNPRTAWAVLGNETYAGNALTVVLDKPTTLNDIVVRQLRRPDNDPTITRLRVDSVTEDNRRSTVTFDLNPGQTRLGIRPASYRQLTFTIASTAGETPAGVGLSEVDLIGADGRRIDTTETIAVGDRLARLAQVKGVDADAIAERTRYVFHRSRLDSPLDEEVDLRRRFTTVGRNDFTVSASLQVTPATPDIVIDSIRNANVGAYGSTRFQNDIAGSSGFNVLDGDPNTQWRMQPNPAENLSIRLAPNSSPRSITIRTPGADVADVSPIESVSVQGFRNTTNDLGERVETPVFGSSTSEPTAISTACVTEDDRGRCLTETTIELPGQQVDRIQIDLRAYNLRQTGIGRFPGVVNDVGVDGVFGLKPTGTRRAANECLELFRIDDQPVEFAIPSLGTLRNDGRPTQACGTVTLAAGQHSIDSTISGEGVLSTVVLAPAGLKMPTANEPATSSDETFGATPTFTVDANSAVIVTNGEAYGPGWFSAVTSSNDDGTAAITERAQAWNTMAGWMLPSGRHEVTTTYQPQRWYIAALAISACGLSLSFVLWWPRKRRRSAPAAGETP